MSKAHKLECELMNCRRELRALGVGMPGDEDELSVLARKIDGAEDKYAVYGEIFKLLMGIYAEWFRDYMENFNLTYQHKGMHIYGLAISDPNRRHKFLISIRVGHDAADEASDLKVCLKINDQCGNGLGFAVAKDYTCVSDLIRYIDTSDVLDMIRIQRV